MSHDECDASHIVIFIGRWTVNRSYNNSLKKINSYVKSEFKKKKIASIKK